MRPNTIPHATCSTVFGVTPSSPANEVNRPVTASSSSNRYSSDSVVISRPDSGRVSSVGSETPSSARAHAPSDAARSCRATQSRKFR